VKKLSKRGERNPKSSEILAYIMMNIKSGTEDEVCEKLTGYSEIKEIAVIYGEYDAIIKVKTDNMVKLDNFITERLRALPNIFLTATMLIAKQYK
jgi:DNA-binding Lrp family transcriptional regulator